MRKIIIPLKTENLFEETFLQILLAEGLDQTRGWFYTLTILVDSAF